ncbi:MAG TPA: hypothetical protein VMG12_04175 [Polyangiaceae bacterium]|nr:hypothetical protein [Polyangiaceae bacterium]
MNGDNVQGEATAFCTFTPFRSWRDPLVHWAVQRFAPGQTDAIRAQRFLHYMCFAIVSRRALRRANVDCRGRLRSGALLFMSAFNGRAEEYFQGFNQSLAAQMDQLWQGCEDWKGARVYKYLAQFIEQYRRPANAYFNAYPDTSDNLRTALGLRAALDELIATAHDRPHLFLEEYRRAARIAAGVEHDGRPA